MKNSRYIAIMAGGVGSRFWPSSTEGMPKQFIDILGLGRTLLQMTYDRSIKIVPNENIIVVTNKAYREIVKEQLPMLPDKNIICEPSRNNTAPCIAFTALHIEAENKDASFAVLSSDHVILKEEEFIAKINQGFVFAETHDSIVTLSIQPTRPDTGYGYIQVDKEDNEPVKKVVSFKEKPDIEIAQKYLDAGNYSWNAGIFIWSIKTVLHAFDLHSNQIIDVLSKDKSKFGSNEEQVYMDEVYPLTEKISVDYAILERAENVYTLTADIGWSDLGTWNSLYSYLEKDQDSNVIQANDIYLSDVKDCIIKTSNHKTIVIKGLENYIVIDEPHALLIYPKSDEQEIKNVVNGLNNKK